MPKQLASRKASDFRGGEDIVRNTQIGLIKLDYNNVVVAVNDKALSLLETSKGDLLGCRIPWGAADDDAQRKPTKTGRVIAQFPEPARWHAHATVELELPSGKRAFKLGIRETRGACNKSLMRCLSLTESPKERKLPRPQPAIFGQYEESFVELSALKSALEQHAIVAMTDQGGHITYVNQSFCDISQYARSELIGQKHSIINSGHHPKSFFDSMWKRIAQGRRWHGEICNRAKDGSLYWVDTMIVPLANSGGRIEGYLSVRYDITGRKSIESALNDEVRRRREAETLLLDVIETLPDAVAAYDADDRLLIFNAAYRDFYDRARDAVVQGATFEEILRHAVDQGQFDLPDDSQKARDALFKHRMREHRNPGEISTQRLSNGRWLQVQELRSRAGNVVGVRTDITALKEAERLLRDQAERDPLTGLFNRSVLIKSLKKQLEHCAKKNACGALIILDLDNFKDINDSLGHIDGDEVLIEIGRRIQATQRANDVVMRLGGDEFAIVLAGLDKPGSLDLFLKRLFKNIAGAIDLSGNKVWTSASAGVSVFPKDGNDPTELLKCADMALYQAKDLGRARHYLFDTSLREKFELREAIAHDLRLALERREISIALQPQFDISSGAHIGFETLARWKKGPIELKPDQFIPVAEEVGLIVALGQQVLEYSLAEVSRMERAGMQPGKVAVNVAASQLKVEDFPEMVGELLQRYELAPDKLDIEITENVLLDLPSTQITRSLERLHQMGVGIALDDFGTGHASLAHLKRFPVDILKLDKSFVSGIGSNPDDDAIVRNIINLAHSLGKTVVAEGVETPDQLRILKYLGCNIGQGFLISKPLSPDQAEQFLIKKMPAKQAKRTG